MEHTIIAVARPKFRLGDTVITTNALQSLDYAEITRGIERHAQGDWGELGPEDRCSNADALRYGGRLMSVFGEGDTRFWIITESDRSVTTVLLPADY